MKKTHIKIILLLVSVCALVFIWRRYEYAQRDPYEVVLTATEWGYYESHEYFSSIESRLGTDGTNELLLRLVTQNVSYGALCRAGRYIEATGKCEFLPQLDAMCRYYEAMPKDTALTYTRLKWNIFRGYYYYGIVNSHFTYNPNICTIAARLREKCEVQYGSPDLFPKLPRNDYGTFRDPWRSQRDSTLYDTLHKP